MYIIKLLNYIIRDKYYFLLNEKVSMLLHIDHRPSNNGATFCSSFSGDFLVLLSMIALWVFSVSPVEVKDLTLCCKKVMLQPDEWSYCYCKH